MYGEFILLYLIPIWHKQLSERLCPLQPLNKQFNVAKWYLVKVKPTPYYATIINMANSILKSSFVVHNSLQRNESRGHLLFKISQDHFISRLRLPLHNNKHYWDHLETVVVYTLCVKSPGPVNYFEYDAHYQKTSWIKVVGF